MEIGYTVWTWGLDTEENFKTALTELEELGYNRFENFIGMADLYMDRTDEFNVLVKNHGFQFIALYNYIADIDADNVENAKKYLEFCKKTGARVMNIQAPDRAGEPSEEDLLKLAKTLDKIGAVAADCGVTLCLHPHFQTTVEQQKEIDFIADNTKPEFVKFCFDTAHTILGKMNICKLLKQYRERIGYIHLKDQDPQIDVEAFRGKWIQEFDKLKRFSELGTKGIDFLEVIQTLDDMGYTGYLIVENDTPTVSNYDGAKTNREYIAKVLHM